MRPHARRQPVKLDTANRSVLALAATSLNSAVWLLCGAAGCILLALIAYEIARDGPGALVGDDALLPAAVFLALVGTGAVLGLRSLTRQAAASRRLAHRIDELVLPAPPALEQAAARTGMTGRLLLVDSDEAGAVVEVMPIIIYLYGVYVTCRAITQPVGPVILLESPLIAVAADPERRASAPSPGRAGWSSGSGHPAPPGRWRSR